MKELDTILNGLIPEEGELERTKQAIIKLFLSKLPEREYPIVGSPNGRSYNSLDYCNGKNAAIAATEANFKEGA